MSDTAAARVVGNTRSYSRTLARIALSARCGPRILAAVPMAGSAGIRQRLQALEDHPLCETLDPCRAVAGVLAGCVMLMGPAARPALPQLAQGLRDGRVETYALILGEMGPAAKAAVPALTAKAQSGCAEAAVALARIDPESPATLAALLQIMRARDRISNDISSLAWAFQLLGPRAAPAVPALAEVLSDEVPDHQEAAVRALSRIGTPEAVTALRGVLHHANGQVRVRAAETVLQHYAGDAEATAALQGGLRDADARVRGGAVSAVSGASASLGTHAPEIVEALLEVVKHPGVDAGENAFWTRVWAIAALRSLGARTPAVIATLTDRLRDQEDMVRLYAAFALAKIDGQPSPVWVLSHRSRAPTRPQPWACGRNLGPIHDISKRECATLPGNHRR